MDKKDFFENYLGGIFAVIAAIAAIIEMAVAGFSADAIVGCVKDLFSMLAVVVIFFYVVYKEWPLKSFRKRLEQAMESLEQSYHPLIREHVTKESNASDVAVNQKLIRYDLARNVNALYSTPCNDYMRFFELDAMHPDRITFFVRQKFFGDAFQPELIARNVQTYLQKNHTGLGIHSQIDKDGACITVMFPHTLHSQKDITQLLSIIDDALFIFVAENKK